MLQAWLILAQEGGGASQQLFSMLPFLVIPLLFYLVLVRPMNKQRHERVALLSSLKKNDKVLTHSGIYGTVVAISEKEDEITVKVDDNVRLRMTKESILRNLSNEEAARAAKAAKASGAGAAKA